MVIMKNRLLSSLIGLCCSAVVLGCAGRPPQANYPRPASVDTNWSSKAAEFADTGIDSDGFRLIVSANETVAAGEATKIRVRIQNITDRELTLHEEGAFQDFDIEVWRSDGPAARTEFGKPFASKDRPRLGSEGFPRLAPGEARDYVLNVGRLYDLTTAGEYYFRVIRWVPKLGGPPLKRMFPSGEVVSSVGKISVVEGGEDDFFGTDVPAENGAPAR